MKRAILGFSLVTSAAAALAMAGAGTAAAEYVGETYGDASEAMTEAGVEPKVATRVGDILGQEDCIVTAAWGSPFMRDAGGEFAHAEGEMLVALNCAGPFATASKPGASVASPLGRSLKAAAEEDAADAEEDALEEVSTPDE